MISVSSVAPYVGAWIETLSNRPVLNSDESHPTWVRGLKLAIFVTISSIITSHPTWVRGLKQLLLCKHKHHILSHPTWVRGLKRQVFSKHCDDSRRTLRGCVD